MDRAHLCIYINIYRYHDYMHEYFLRKVHTTKIYLSFVRKENLLSLHLDVNGNGWKN